MNDDKKNDLIGIAADPEGYMHGAASRVFVIRWFIAGAALTVLVAIILTFFIGQGLDQRDAKTSQKTEVETEAAIEAAFADYERKALADIARDREAVVEFYEDTTRHTESYVQWRLDEALQESNRIIGDAIRDAELIRSEAVGTSQIGATE